MPRRSTQPKSITENRIAINANVYTESRPTPDNFAES